MGFIPLFFSIAVLATFASCTDFTAPVTGDKVLINQVTELKWPLATFVAGSSIEVVATFSNDRFKDLLQDTTLSAARTERGNCFDVDEFLDATEAIYPLNLTLPVDGIQGVMDMISIPYTASDLIDIFLSNVEAIGSSEREVTLQLFACGASSATYESTIILSDARMWSVSIALIVALVALLI
ncbi:hypothetical protein J8273_0111 [Carpediemonas membranifera]|uniref:Uncharacterized protein n=1 Tax=Carpediemonas membranifera TaxID=201153 RepID=A0A8J6B7S2_9EUKA|nr:hypothetical protein J8273_0111 [Carpediemonas membranifera]|eukprot:KAG9394904.1 hypothetical protein J8273_0111 [Carpediemonas membranifera]